MNDFETLTIKYDLMSGCKSKIFEAQNWYCAYCQVRMFAGHPSEDIHMAARSYGIRLFNTSGCIDRKGLRTLRYLRATSEHLIARGDNGTNAKENKVGACLWCNSRRHKKKSKNSREYSAEEWFEIIQSQIKRGDHPHARFVGKNENGLSCIRS